MAAPEDVAPYCSSYIYTKTPKTPIPESPPPYGHTDLICASSLLLKNVFRLAIIMYLFPFQDTRKLTPLAGAEGK